MNGSACRVGSSRMSRRRALLEQACELDDRGDRAASLLLFNRSALFGSMRGRLTWLIYATTGSAAMPPFVAHVVSCRGCGE
jgi:hypothetical protein